MSDDIDNRLSWWGKGMLRPWAGWMPLDAEDTLALELPVRQEWEVFSIAWLGRGIALFARPARARRF